MRSTEELDEALDRIPEVPPQTCQTVDKQIKEIQSAARDAREASRATEDSSACTALEEAESALDDAASALDTERDVCAKLRDAGQTTEVMARFAIQGCAERDIVIQDLEAQVGELEGRAETSQKVIDWLGEQLKEARQPWWRALASTAKVVFWRARARALGHRNRDLRWARVEADEAVSGTFDALMEAHNALLDQEWREGMDPQTWDPIRECPECMVQWRHGWQFVQPEHDLGCKRGEAVTNSRRALQTVARRVGVDPHHIAN